MVPGPVPMHFVTMLVRLVRGHQYVRTPRTVRFGIVWRTMMVGVGFASILSDTVICSFPLPFHVLQAL